MKTILVLTDFSKSALIAAETAVMLAGRLHANLLLFYADSAIPVNPFYPGIFQGEGDDSWKMHCKTEMDKVKDHLMRLISLMKTDSRKPGISRKIAEGDLGAHVTELVKNGNVEMIAMGAPSGSKIDHVLIGSDTSAVIGAADCPVLIVPANGSITALDRVVFATNYHKSDIFAIEYLVELGKLFAYQLEIVHISLYGAKESNHNNEVMDFVKKLSGDIYPRVLFKEIKGKHLFNRLVQFYKERETDLLSMTHQQHTLLSRMLKEGTVMKSLATQKFPMLIFPPGIARN
ncbi:universal stress protein [Pedobacter caeni]|uniref:Nucleotide-binding universal stress protein, UspA family n=1 Tax=Pedobacter caeni TaxID=288992 RepID=A0A1M5BC10_9SPHI|nr:universal stress protein [Pedobacter caeni]SHF39857.1 Nucleotide-binding universal stress protein, UspA family [Pedobacter caeni]